MNNSANPTAPSWTRHVRAAVLATVLVGVTGAGAALASPAAAATRLGGVDMQRACDTQHPGMGLRATVQDQRNAYSWTCLAPFGYRQGINVNQECVTQFGGGAYAGLTDSRNPYSWYCQR